jgi:hypothetical protein
MTALSIATQARERLGDLKKQRWTDSRLLSIISMGQQDICKWTNFLRRKTYIPLVNKNSVYNLPTDCYRVSRVEYNDILLPLYTRDDMDIPRVMTSDYVAFKSNLDRDKIEIYPSPSDIKDSILWLKGDLSDQSYVDQPFGVVTSISGANYIIIGDNFGEIAEAVRQVTEENISDKYGELFDYAGISPTFDFGTNLGVVVGIDHTLASVYGFVTSVKEGHIVSNTYGLIADVGYISNTIKVYYVALPPKLKYLEATLVIPDLWEDLLIRYTVGTALQDDNDANNIQRGEMELQKYQQQVLKLRAESSKDFSGGAKDKLVTNYRRI